MMIHCIDVHFFQNPSFLEFDRSFLILLRAFARRFKITSDSTFHLHEAFLAVKSRPSLLQKVTFLSESSLTRYLLYGGKYERSLKAASGLLLDVQTTHVRRQWEPSTFPGILSKLDLQNDEQSCYSSPGVSANATCTHTISILALF